MDNLKSKTGRTDPIWRYIRIALLLWGIVQMAWLYFRIDRYSLFTGFLFLFMLIGSFAIRLQLRNEE